MSFRGSDMHAIVLAQAKPMGDRSQWHLNSCIYTTYVVIVIGVKFLLARILMRRSKNLFYSSLPRRRESITVYKVGVPPYVGTTWKPVLQGFS